MIGATPPLLQYAFMAWCLVKKKEANGQHICWYSRRGTPEVLWLSVTVAKRASSDQAHVEEVETEFLWTKTLPLNSGWPCPWNTRSRSCVSWQEVDRYALSTVRVGRYVSVLHLNPSTRTRHTAA